MAKTTGERRKIHSRHEEPWETWGNAMRCAIMYVTQAAPTVVVLWFLGHAHGWWLGWAVVLFVIAPVLLIGAEVLPRKITDRGADCALRRTRRTCAPP